MLVIFFLKPAVWIAPHLDEIVFEGSAYSLKSISAVVASLVVIPLTLLGLALKRVGEWHSVDGVLRREYTKAVFLYDKYSSAIRSNQKISVIEKELINQIEVFFNKFVHKDVDLLIAKIRANPELFEKICSSAVRLHAGRLKPHPLRKLEFHLKRELAISELDRLLHTWKQVTLFDLKHFISKNLPFFVSKIENLNEANELQEKLFTLSQNIPAKFGRESYSLAHQVFCFAKGLSHEATHSVVLVPDVLEEIFLRLTEKEFPARDVVDIVRDLQAISLVCKEWEKSSRKIKGLFIDRHDLSLVEFNDHPIRAIESIARYQSNHANLADFLHLSDEHLDTVARIRPTLTHLSIQSDRIKDFSLGLFQELRSLTIYGCKNYSEEKLVEALPSLKKLKALKLIHCRHFKLDHLSSARSLGQLKVFHLRHSNKLHKHIILDSEKIKQMLAHFSELEDLDIRCQNIDETHLHQLAARLDKNRLKALGFCEVSQLLQLFQDDPYTVNRFISLFPNLEVLRLNWVLIENMNEFSETLDGLANLHTLDLGREILVSDNNRSFAMPSRLTHVGGILALYLFSDTQLKSFKNLTCLKMGTPQEQDLEDLPKFENLRTLQIRLTSTFKAKWMICFQKMKFLEHLSLDVLHQQTIPPLQSLVCLKTLKITCQVNPGKFLKTLPSFVRLRSLTVCSPSVTQQLFDQTALALPLVDLRFEGARDG